MLDAVQKTSANNNTSTAKIRPSRGILEQNNYPLKKYKRFTWRKSLSGFIAKNLDNSKECYQQ